MQNFFTKSKYVIALFIFLINVPILSYGAVTPASIPGSAEPGVVSKALSTEAPAPSKQPLSPVVQPKQAQPGFGPEAEKVKFKLTRIVLHGNHVYSDQRLLLLYKDKLNKTITVAELIDIVRSITNFYRNNGYILSRALLPSQRIHEGVVHIQILEGFIDEVVVVGQDGGAKKAIERYVSQISQSRPLRIGVLEHYLRLANSIPGVSVKAVLEPSKTTLAASTLTVVTETRRVSGYATYDNYGTRYIGPKQVTVSGSLNSMLRSGDTSRLTYITTSRPKELKYVDFFHSTPLGRKGWRFEFDANQAETQPGLNLRPLKIDGKSTTYTGNFVYPLILSRATDLNLHAEFDYIDSGTNTFGETLYIDHLRTLTFGANFDHADAFNGVNNLNADVVQGLNILGASQNTNSQLTSRFGAAGIFTKLECQGSRVQRFGATRYSARVLAKGQYSFEPLLATEQFAFGGSILGRGYDVADIIGDLGFAGSVELRADIFPEWYFLNYLQPYIFYDGGVIYNRKNVGSVSNSKQSETSAGGGVRFLFTKNLSANFMIGQPLTKQDTTEALVGNGRRPRALFSLVLSV